MPLTDYPPRLEVTELVASAARTTSGQSAAFAYPVGATGRVYLRVTAVSGTSPTLDVVIEDSPDGAAWYQVSAFAQKTAVSTEAVTLPTTVGPYLRVRWTIGGTTPSFTFAVVAAARPA